MAEINWGLLDPNSPAKLAGSFYEGQQQRQANALQAQQLQHAQTANQLGQYQLGQAKRTDEQQNALADVYRTAVNPQTGAIDSNALMKGLAERGLGAKIPEVQKQLMEAQKAKIAQALEATKLAKVGATQVMANPNLSTAMTVLQQLQAQTGMDQSGEIARLQALGDNPEAIKQWAAGHALEADKLLPKLETLNLGGVERLQQRDPLTGQVIGKPIDIGKTATPGEILSSRIAGANLALNQQKFAWEKANPGYKIQETDQGIVAVNERNPADTKPVTLGGEQLKGKMPEMQKKELMTINQQKSTIQGALNAVDETPDAFSMGRGLAGTSQVGESLAGRVMTPEENQARSYVFNNVSKIINERAGAAQSKQELARLNGFLPGQFDSPQQIKDKLHGFQKYLEDMEAGTKGQPTKPKTSSVSGGWSVVK